MLCNLFIHINITQAEGLGLDFIGNILGSNPRDGWVSSKFSHGSKFTLEKYMTERLLNYMFYMYSNMPQLKFLK